jgi:hypothetical protein
MPSTVALLPHDLAVIEALETIGKPVGFAEAPPGALEGVQRRTGPDYMIVYPIGGIRDGNLGDPFIDADIAYQITCVGRVAAGVRWLVDETEPALLTVAIAGRSVLQIVQEDGGQVRPDLDVEPPVFIATVRYRLSTVPT